MLIYHRKIYLFYFLLFILPSLKYAITGTKNVQVEILREYKQIKKKSESKFYVKINFYIQPGWHIYWKNPGDSGKKTKINWSLPKHIKLQNLVWSPPIKINVGSILSYGYKKSAFILATFKSHKIKNNTSEQHILKVKLEWLECKEICLSGQAELSINLSSNKNIKNNSLHSKFKKKYFRYSQNNKKLEAYASYNNKNLELIIPNLYKHREIRILNNSTIKEKVYFFIDKPNIIQHTQEQLYFFNHKKLKFIFPLNKNYFKTEDKISGYLIIWQDTTQFIYHIEANIQKKYKFYVVSTIIILLTFFWYLYTSRATLKNDKRI